MQRPCLILALIALTGCYVLRQAGGQMQILVGQEPIEPLIESDRLTADEARKLIIVSEVREFAVRELGMPPSDNYTTFYDTSGKPVSYAVSACRKDRFESYRWSFPVVGAFDYKGFFRKEDAIAEARALESAGYDTTIREVLAYSTLGWFRDPVFSSMLRRTEADLAAVILHELTHGAVFAPGATDFNEKLATFVGQRGALQFLAGRTGARSREVARAEAEFHDDTLFDAFMRDVYERLNALYRSDEGADQKLIRREEIFAGARAEFTRLKTRLKTPAYLFVEHMPLNNAEILANLRYGGYALFERVFRRASESWVIFFAWMRTAAASEDPMAFVERLAAECAH
ncbi:MAG: aminopeptidase [Planctomycetes bacterium]|nr:aminopeptidase [Planctomycetota bacterium]